STYGMSLHVHEIAGIAPNACLDTIGTNMGTGASATVTTNAAIARSNAYVVAFFANNHDSGASSYVVGSGYTFESATLDPQDNSAMTEAANVPVAGIKQVATATQTMPGAVWQAMI